MENKSIWDIISKLTGTNGEKKESNDNDLQTPPTQPVDEHKNSGGLQGSFSKSYNPFITDYFERPQVTSKKTEKPTRTTIELKNSKNINRNALGESSPSIVDLINKHNYYSTKIRGKKE